MALLDYLKKLKYQLSNKNKNNNESIVNNNAISEENIEIVIENYSNLFEDEPQTIKNGAQVLYKNGHVDSFEEGIIVFATMIRGLQYSKTEKDENGTTKIILRDLTQKNTLSKKL